MPTLDRPRSAVQRQVEAYEEWWSNDHIPSEHSVEIEEAIAVGISMGELMERVDQLWRERVFRGVGEFSESDDRNYRESFRKWLETTDKVLVTIVAERLTQEVRAQIERLRSLQFRIRGMLRDWASPKLSRAIGLREMELSESEAAEFDRIISRTTIETVVSEVGLRSTT